jgi:glycosyltransferase involved in cell wall biosynthesis
MSFFSRFFRSDPDVVANASRSKREVYRALEREPVSATLYISHLWGGGIQRFIDDRAAEFRQAGRDLFFAVPWGQGASLATLVAPNAVRELAPAPRFDFADDAQSVARVWRALNIEFVELHSTAGWSSAIVEGLPAACRAAGVPYRITLHDYLAVCPNGLVDETRFYCGERGFDQCLACMRHPRLDARIVHPDLVAEDGSIDIVRWRSAYVSLLRAADQIIALNGDTAKRFRHYFGDVDIEICPPKETIAAAQKKMTPRSGARVKITSIGFLQLHKGFEILLKCAEDAVSRSLPIDFSLVGSTIDDDAARKHKVAVTGRYAETEVFRLLAAEQPDLIFLPSIWPETHLFTLSIALATGLPVAVFNLGAQADRLNAAASPHLLISPDLATRPDLINDRLLDFCRSF